MGVLFCALVMGLTGCNGNNPEYGGITKLDKSTGCLNGGFSVAKGKYVRFSMGNLQYTQSTQTWSFAKNQYDMLGESNVRKVDFLLADKIDLFGWSGSTGIAKWGISTSWDSEDYSGDFADWGQNAISNGGNKANQWRTLTADEWDYLINNRPKASSLRGKASVNGVNGLVLLPDGWKLPKKISFTSGFGSFEEGDDAYQSFTATEWHKMESAGAVFLPASGACLDLDVFHVGYYGCYWSATPFNEDEAKCLLFYHYGAYMHYNYRVYAQAVRLVRDAK